MTRTSNHASTYCPIDGILTSDCPHVCCVRCGAVPACGGCFRCSACHDDYAECGDWLIAVGVVVVERERGEDNEQD